MSASPPEGDVGDDVGSAWDDGADEEDGPTEGPSLEDGDALPDGVAPPPHAPTRSVSVSAATAEKRVTRGPQAGGSRRGR